MNHYVKKIRCGVFALEFEDRNISKNLFYLMYGH